MDEKHKGLLTDLLYFFRMQDHTAPNIKDFKKIMNSAGMHLDSGEASKEFQLFIESEEARKTIEDFVKNICNPEQRSLICDAVQSFKKPLCEEDKKIRIIFDMV